MTRYGYFLSSEEYEPGELVRQARLAEEAGFDGLWISDHFHPWLDEQGQSGFVWSMIGAISQACSLPVTTAVTCPLMPGPSRDRGAGGGDVSAADRRPVHPRRRHRRGAERAHPGRRWPSAESGWTCWRRQCASSASC